MALKDKDARKEYNRAQYLKRKNALEQVTKQPENVAHILPPNLEENIVLHIGECYSVKSSNTATENPLHNSTPINDTLIELEETKERLQYAENDIKEQEAVIKEMEAQFEINLTEKEQVIADQEREIIKIKDEINVLKLLLAEKDNQISFFKELLLVKPVANKKEPFNLENYLAKDCSNTRPIEDFKNAIRIEYKDLDNLKTMTYEDNMKQIIDRIYNTFDFTDIPIKCSNLREKTVYIRTDNGWIKDDMDIKNNYINGLINRIDNVLMRYMPEYRKNNPDYNIADSPAGILYDSVAIKLNDISPACKTRLINYVMSKSVVKK